MSYIPEPITRIDKYLAYIAGNMDVALPDHPITRKEHYLAAWAEKSGFEDVDVAGEPPLTLENGIGKPLKGLRVYGRSKQVTTTGVQLLNFNSGNIANRDGMTINISDDGGFFVDGTPQNPYTNMYNSILSLSAGDYYFRGGNGAAGTVYGQITITKPDGTLYYANDGKVTIDGTEKEIKFTIQNGNNTEHIDHYTLYTMLNAGSTPLPWEPYTGGKPSPSPNYPQEIESVGTKWSTGANLVDVHNAIKINAYGLAVAVKDDGTIIISGTSNNNSKNLSFSFLNNKFPFPLTSIFKCFDVEEKNCKLSSVRRTNTSDATNNGIAIDINQINSGEPIYCSFKLVVSEKAVEEYEPYTGGVPKPYGDKIGVTVGNGVDESQSMSISTPNGLPGIPVASGGNYTDADGQQWICDEIDLARGVYVQKIAKEVLNGTEQVKWVSQIGDVVRFSIETKYHVFPNYDADNSRKGLNGFFSHGTYYTNYSLKDIHGYADGKNMYIFLPIDILGNDADSIAAYIMEQHENGSPLTMYYIVVTPIETPLTSDQLAAYKALHTYKGTTIIDNDAGAYMSVKYEKMK